MNKQRRTDLAKAINLLQEIEAKWDEAKEIIEQAASEERDGFENLTDGLQASERGQRMDEAASALEEVHSDLDNVDLASMIGQIETASE